MDGLQDRFVSVKKAAEQTFSVSAGKGPMNKKPTCGAAANREGRKPDLIHFNSSCVSHVTPRVASKAVSYAGAAWHSTQGM